MRPELSEVLAKWDDAQDTRRWAMDAAKLDSLYADSLSNQVFLFLLSTQHCLHIIEPGEGSNELKVSMRVGVQNSKNKSQKKCNGWAWIGGIARVVR
jgi:hypothetical protein